MSTRPVRETKIRTAVAKALAHACDHKHTLQDECCDDVCEGAMSHACCDEACDAGVGTLPDSSRDGLFLRDAVCCEVVDSDVSKYKTAIELAVWRDQFNMSVAKQQCQRRQPAYSMAVWSSGGCCDTMAGIRSGFIPIWGTEINTWMAKMWEDLTKTPCLGDTFAIDMRRQRRPILLKSGQPCPDFSSCPLYVSSRQGVDGTTGWQYVKQCDQILALSPVCFVLEMVANVINHGDVVNRVLQSLSVQYHCHARVLRCAEYGDPSNRERLFIVGFHRVDVGDIGANFEWPVPLFDEVNYHCARDVAVPDDQVPAQYWLHDFVPPVRDQTATPMQINVVGSLAPGMGFSERPHKAQGWDGIMPTQTTHNGGGRRVTLAWQPGQPIVETRLTTPVETVRIASLPEDYMQWCKSFREDDRFLRECVNMGVPLRTSCAIDDCIHAKLIAAGVPFDMHVTDDVADLAAQQKFRSSVDSYPQSWVGLYNKIRSIKVDTGATKTFLYTDVEPWMEDSQDSNTEIHVAKKGEPMRGSMDGVLKSYVINLAAYQDVPTMSPMEMPATTVPELSRELLSVDSYFRYGGYNVLLRQPDYEDGVSELYKPPSGTSPAVRIPLSYDWYGAGGWKMYYIPARCITGEEMAMLAAHMQDVTVSRGKQRVADMEDTLVEAQQSLHLHAAVIGHHAFSDFCCCIADDADESVQSLFKAMQKQKIPDPTRGDIERVPHQMGQHDANKAKPTNSRQEMWQVINAAMVDEKAIRGVKTGLKRNRNKWSAKDFHKFFGHLGSDPDCEICKLVKGAMRPIFTRVDPHRETRPGHTWVMDGITFSHRSMKGCKYLIVMRDLASGAYHLIPLVRKSDVVSSVYDWIVEMRRNPLYSQMSYPVISVIKTDRESTWGPKAREWQKMAKRPESYVEMVYTSDRHAQENGAAEVACKTVEHCIRALLMQANLNPNWWQLAAADAEFLLNRFPAVSHDIAAPMDGDYQRPIEALSRGFYSRRQIDRELSYYIPVGSPALVHDPKIKGSRLQPKCRWGIAAGMYRESPIWMCPYTKAEWHSKSYSAYQLKSGYNYAQMLKLPAIESIQQSASLPSDSLDDGEVMCQLYETGGDKPDETVIAVARQHIKPMQHSRVIPDEGVLPADAFIDVEGAGPAAVSVSGERGELLIDDEGVLYYPNVVDDLLPKPDVLPTGGTSETEKNDRMGNEQPTTANGENVSTPDMSADGSGMVQSKSRKYSKTGKGGKGSSQRVVDGSGRASEGANGSTKVVSVASERASTDLSPEGDAAPKAVKSIPGPKLAKGASKKQVASILKDGGWDQWVVDVVTQPDVLDDLDAKDLRHNEKMAVVAGINQAFKVIMKKKPLAAAVPRELWTTYREWYLRTYPDVQPEDIPWSDRGVNIPRGAYVKSGLKFPVPSGALWRDMLYERRCEKARRANAGDDVEQMLADVAVAIQYGETAKAKILDNRSRRKYITKAKAAKAKKIKAQESGQKLPPRNLNEAFHGADALHWVHSSNEEMDGLTNNGVVQHGLSLDELKNAGVPVDPTTGIVKPIGLSVVLTHKYVDGILDRYKTRFAVAGHSGNMQKNIHFDETFAPSPNQNATRLLQAVMVQRRWKQYAFDIKQAYTHADLPDGKRIALKYPPGFERFDEDGNPLYMLLLKNLYGHPAASRAWSKTRDAFILEYFNDPKLMPGWSCRRCRADPCVFRFTFTDPRKEDAKMQEAIALIHTDDVDMVGSSEEMMKQIFTVCDKKWGCKEVSPSFVLGVKRVVTGDENSAEMSVEMSMQAYVEGMVAAFDEHLDSRPVSTPFPEHVMLSKSPFVKVRKGLHADIQKEEAYELRHSKGSSKSDYFKTGSTDRAPRGNGGARNMTTPTQPSPRAHGAYDSYKYFTSNTDANVDANVDYDIEEFEFLKDYYKADDDNYNAERRAEGRRVLDRGYMRAVGMILWAARNVYLECMLGVSYLCRVMSCPTEAAWDAAMHMIRWMRGQKHRGLVYSSSGNSVPIAFSDASNKSDPHDGHCQFGYCVQLSGAPIMATSKKLNHVSPSGSASHCEYMALCECNKAVVWLRQLLEELEMHDMIAVPTRVYGDNKQANSLCKEDFVSTGNQYIYLSYHFNKEVVELGFVDVRFVRTKSNFADVFTKPVSKGVSDQLFMKLLGYEKFDYSSLDADEDIR